MSIRIGIYGYGNLGRGVELAIAQNPDLKAVGVFTRRDPESVKTLTGIPVYAANAILEFKNEIDVVILCGGSATDLPEQTPYLAQYFNVVDSFDTHAKIPQHSRNVEKAAVAARKRHLFPQVGILECFRSQDYTQARCLWTGTIIPSGVRV